MRGTLFGKHGRFVLGVLIAVGLGACSNDQTLTNGTTFNGTFHQIDRIGRPLIVEILTPWSNHDAIARSSPIADAGTLASNISAFMTSNLPHRSQAIADFVTALFAKESVQPPSAFLTSSDVLVIDMSQPGPAQYLGVESGGKITGTGGVNPSGRPSFGGRALTDDFMAINLGLIFGSLVPEISTVPDDGQEQDGRNGRPNLSNDFVGPQNKHFLIGPPYEPVAFPYLGSPV